MVHDHHIFINILLMNLHLKVDMVSEVRGITLSDFELGIDLVQLGPIQIQQDMPVEQVIGRTEMVHRNDTETECISIIM